MNRQARPFVLPVAVLLLTAACRGDGRERNTAAPPVATPPPAGPVVPTVATPGAAAITAVPRTPAPAATQSPDSAAAEAVLRRVVLFPTDLPPGMTAQPPVLEDNDTAAQRTPDPMAFLERARRWGRQAAYHAAFENPSVEPPGAGVGAVSSSAVRFAGEDGARAQFEALRTGGFGAVRAAALTAPSLSLGPTGADAAQAPPVGDEALAWRLSATATGRLPGATVAFRRRALIAVVVLIGDGDIAALTRVLDTRAVEAQRP